MHRLDVDSSGDGYFLPSSVNQRDTLQDSKGPLLNEDALPSDREQKQVVELGSMPAAAPVDLQALFSSLGKAIVQVSSGACSCCPSMGTFFMDYNYWSGFWLPVWSQFRGHQLIAFATDLFSEIRCRGGATLAPWLSSGKTAPWQEAPSA